MKANQINDSKNVLRFYEIEKAKDWSLKARFNKNQHLKIVDNN